MRGKVLKEIRLLIIISTSHTHSGSVARMKINELPWELFYAPLWLVRIIFNKRFIHQLPIDDDLLVQLIKRKQLNVTLHAVISSHKSCLFIFLISTHKQKNNIFSWLSTHKPVAWFFRSLLLKTISRVAYNVYFDNFLRNFFLSPLTFTRCMVSI